MQAKTDSPVPSTAPKAATVSGWRSRFVAGVSLGTMALMVPAMMALAARWSWRCELAAHFRAQYFWGLLLGTVLLIPTRRWRVALVSGSFCAVHAVLLWPFYVPAAAAGASGPKLRVVSLNIHAANRQHDRVLEFIRTAKPDVVIVLELNGRWDTAFESLSPKLPYRFVRTQEDNFGIGIYSRWPLEEVRLSDLSELCPAIRARIEVDGAPVWLVAAHPYPPMSAELSATRNGQLAALGDLVRSLRGAVIVAGDLNTTSWSPAFVDLIARTGLSDSRLGQGIQSSWHSRLPRPMRIPIDHCLVSPGIAVRGREIGPDVGSDHLPVVVDVQLP